MREGTEDKLRGAVILEAVVALPLLFTLFFGLYKYGEILNRHTLLQQFSYASALIASDNTDDVARRRIAAYRNQFILLDSSAVSLDQYLEANHNAQQENPNEADIGNLALTATDPQFESGTKLVRVNSRSLFVRTFGGCGEGGSDPNCLNAPILQNGYAAPSLINRGAAVIENLNQFESNPGAGFPPVVVLNDCHGVKTNAGQYGGVIEGSIPNQVMQFEGGQEVLSLADCEGAYYNAAMPAGGAFD